MQVRLELAMYVKQVQSQITQGLVRLIHVLLKVSFLLVYCSPVDSVRL